MDYYNFSDLADAAEAVLQASESQLRLEQAVHGLDRLSETQFQALLADGLRPWYSVAREVHYPSSAGKKLTHRNRCDLVLTPEGRPLRIDARPADLFAPVGQTAPEDALWVEMKLAWQFRDPGVHHSGYGAKWSDAVVSDLRKMEQDPLIRQAALVLVVFNESEAVLTKDLELFEDVLARKQVLAGFRQVRSIGILDRIGHRLCSVAIWPTVQRQEVTNL